MMFPTFDDIKLWYTNGFWTAAMVKEAERLNYITEEQLEEILNEH
ncbi:XkdX family protein [Enterococcus gallinarum]|nr:XkdX family protein [Enterococcus gallinarum]MBO6417341.1 XkdX family protein [Enterococcus gallinarum]MBO6423414.1 XkdX family protein [Enterococcus gallinarum]